MAVEKTFSMLKPGVLQRRLAGEILARIERKGLKVVALKMMAISKGLAERQYAEHLGKGFYEVLIALMTSGPVVAMVVEGEDAVAQMRRLCGATKADEALPGTIRGDFALHTPRNLIHASDSAASAAREIGLFFDASEICPWADPNDAWI
jgi:nucleoside-diphosphate kinase